MCCTRNVMLPAVFVAIKTSVTWSIYMWPATLLDWHGMWNFSVFLGRMIVMLWTCVKSKCMVTNMKVSVHISQCYNIFCDEMYYKKNRRTYHSVILYRYNDLSQNLRLISDSRYPDVRHVQVSRFSSAASSIRSMWSVLFNCKYILSGRH